MASLIELIRRRTSAPQDSGRPAEPRWLRWLAWGSLALYAVMCVGPWSGASWRAEWDSALYLETARSLTRGEGYTYLGEPFFLRPPGLSWLLSLLMDGEGALPIAAANRLLMAGAAGAIVLLFLALRRRFGTLLALAVALLTGTSPLYVKQFNYILSEFPYLALVFAAMLVAASWGRLPLPSWRSSLLQAPLLAGAFYLRSQALLLIPGVVILEWKRRGLRKALLPGLLLLVACLPWMLHASELANEVPAPGTQFKLHDYSTALFHQDPGNPDSPLVSVEGWLLRIKQNGAGLVNSALSSLHLDGAAAEPGEPWPTGRVLLGALLSLGLVVGFVSLLRTGWTLFEWFVATNTLLILVYFTYAPRLAMPLVPALYLYLLALPIALTRKRWSWAGMLVANLLTVALLAANLTQLERHQREPQHVATLRRDVNAMAAWAREHTEPDAVLLCKQGPMVGVKSDRKTYSSRFEYDPGIIERLGIDYVIFFGGQGTLLEQEALRRGGERWVIEGSKRIVAYRLPARVQDD